MNVTIRSEIATDVPAIGNVHGLAFGGEAEATLVDALRAGGHSEASLVAEVDGRVVGHILFSRAKVLLGNQQSQALSLAPMAVLPECQRQGIGTQLVEIGLAACRQQGHERVFVLGHPGFYGRFGFTAEAARCIESPFGGGDAWMAVDWSHDSLPEVEGRIEFAAPFLTLL